MNDSSKRDDLYTSIYMLVNEIPKGRVATYGQVASLVGCGPRQVGYALSRLPAGTRIPWHRVVNREGRISLGSVEGGYQRQQGLLQEEGVSLLNGRIDLKVFNWKPV